MSAWDVVLGIDWLFRVGPLIDFREKQVHFKWKETRRFPNDPTMAVRRAIQQPSSVTAAATSETPTKAVTLAATISEFGEQGTIELTAAATTEDLSLERVHSLLSPIYRDLIHMFSEAASNQLPEHSERDHAINLLPGEEPPYGPIYSPV